MMSKPILVVKEIIGILTFISMANLLVCSEISNAFITISKEVKRVIPQFGWGEKLLLDYIGFSDS